MDIVAIINDTLESIEKESVKKYKNLDYPIVFIVAPPRSGTTLLYQLLTLKYDFFYPTNFMAKFYKAPYILAKMIENLEFDRETSDFQSTLGNTNSFLEPHEWGWFWQRFFFENDDTLYNELCALQSLYKKPMIFKNIYFNYEIQKLNKLCKEAVFLRIRRDPYEVIFSIYNAIEAKKGPIGSKKHKKYYEKFIGDKLELATLEYLYDTLLLDKQLENMRIIETTYNQIVSAPENFLKKFENDFYNITNTKLQMNKKELDLNKIKCNSNLDERTKSAIALHLKQYESFSLEEIAHLIFQSQKND